MFTRWKARNTELTTANCLDAPEAVRWLDHDVGEVELAGDLVEQGEDEAGVVGHVPWHDRKKINWYQMLNETERPAVEWSYSAAVWKTSPEKTFLEVTCTNIFTGQQLVFSLAALQWTLPGPNSRWSCSERVSAAILSCCSTSTLPSLLELELETATGSTNRKQGIYEEGEMVNFFCLVRVRLNGFRLFREQRG